MTDQQIKFADICTDADKQHFAIARQVLTSDQYSKALNDSRLAFNEALQSIDDTPAMINTLRRIANIPITQAVMSATGKSTFELNKLEKEVNKGNRYAKHDYKKYITGKKREIKSDREYKSDCGLWSKQI